MTDHDDEPGSSDWWRSPTFVLQGPADTILRLLEQGEISRKKALELLAYLHSATPFDYRRCPPPDPPSAPWEKINWCGDRPRTGTWCPECGFGVYADEDGCCTACGNTCTGNGTEEALALREWKAGATGAATISYPPRIGPHTEEAYLAHNAAYAGASEDYRIGADVVAAAVLAVTEERDDWKKRAEGTELFLVARRACQADEADGTPIVVVAGGLVGLAHRCDGGGYATTIVDPHDLPRHGPCWTYHDDADRKVAEYRVRRHMAQRLFVPRGPDGSDVLDSADRAGIEKHACWVRWQRLHEQCTAAGITDANAQGVGAFFDYRITQGLYELIGELMYRSAAVVARCLFAASIDPACAVDPSQLQPCTVTKDYLGLHSGDVVLALKAVKGATFHVWSFRRRVWVTCTPEDLKLLGE